MKNSNKIRLFSAVLVLAALATGCGSQNNAPVQTEPTVPTTTQPVATEPTTVQPSTEPAVTELLFEAAPDVLHIQYKIRNDYLWTLSTYGYSWMCSQKYQSM